MPYRKVTYLEQIWVLIKFKLTTGNGKGTLVRYTFTE